MKKKVIHFVQYALIKILFFGAVYPLHAQISNPSSWESFVGSDENRLVSDTFRLQTFGDSEWIIGNIRPVELHKFKIYPLSTSIN